MLLIKEFDKFLKTIINIKYTKIKKNP